MRSLIKASLLFAALIWLAGPSGTAQIKLPKPPDAYDVQIRYRIQADRNERVLQFEAMTKYFDSLGFKENETDESDLAPFDPTAKFMSGSIPSKTARELLADRRVRTILLTPQGYKTPDMADARVRVLLELGRSREQLALARQIETALTPLGFQRDLGFDTRKFTVLRGTVPAGSLPKLIRDLRYQPSGWLLPETSPDLLAKLPDGTLTPHLVAPLADVVPIRVIEVLGAAEAVPAVVALPPIPADQPHLNKWTAELRRRLADEMTREAPLRLEVVLVTIPQDLDVEWRRPFNRIGAAIEGRVGQVVTVLVPQGAKAADLAALTEVSSVRLPRISRGAALPPAPKNAKDDGVVRASATQEPKLPPPVAVDSIKLSGVDRLHAIGKNGQGTRIVILDSDFAGWDKQLKGPGKVTFIDLSAERHRDLKAEPMLGDSGRGTQSAQVVRTAAPAADLLLVRIPVDAPYHVINVARAIRGDQFRTEGLVTRRMEIETELDAHALRSRDALAEYRQAFDDFSDELPARQRRVAAQQALKKLGEEERSILARLVRIEELEAEITKLRGANVVLSLHYWETGFPLDAASGISRFLEEWLAPSQAGYARALTKPRAAAKPLWFQPAGDTGGQTWTGLFRDEDNNGAMEFAGPNDDLPAGSWSRELNFLSVLANGKPTLDLTAGAKVRISVQWREPHDPTLPEEDYRVPVAPIRLQLVKQRDPHGEKFASDEIDLIAASEGAPARLHLEPYFGVYEHSLELTLPADGRYAVRVEGKVPASVRPPGVPALPDQEVKWELRPRVFVESVDGKSRFVLADFATRNGGVAVPGDTRSVFAIGAAGTDGKPLPTSAAGAGPNTALETKPDLLGPSSVPALGDTALTHTDVAAAFTAGWAAAILSAGLPATSFPHALEIKPGGVIEIPNPWKIKK